MRDSTDLAVIYTELHYIFPAQVVGVCDEPGSLLLKRATATVQASSSVFILMQYLSHFNCTDNSLSIILTPRVDAMYVFTAIQDQKMLKSISDGFIPTQESQHLSFSWWSVRWHLNKTSWPQEPHRVLVLLIVCSAWHPPAHSSFSLHLPLAVLLLLGRHPRRCSVHLP